MRRIGTAVGVVVLAVSACGGGGSTPKAFPGSALDKANEYVREAEALGLPHGKAEHTAEIYDTDGDGFCSFKSATERRNAEAATARAQPNGDLRINHLVVKIYCPWLL